MNKVFLALALFGISLFLLVSSVSAEEICSDDSNESMEVVSGEQSIETSEISNDSVNSDISLDATGNSTGNASNNTPLILQKSLISFHPQKISVQHMEKRPNSQLKYLIMKEKLLIIH